MGVDLPLMSEDVCFTFLGEYSTPNNNSKMNLRCFHFSIQHQVIDVEGEGGGGENKTYIDIYIYITSACYTFCKHCSIGTINHHSLTSHFQLFCESSNCVLLTIDQHVW